MQTIFKLLFTAISSAFGSILTAVLTDKFLIRLFVKLGDYLVGKTKNPLDNKIMADVKEALKEYL